MKATVLQEPPVLQSSLMTMTDTEFHLLRDLVYKRIGLNLTEKKRSMLIGRLQKLLRTSGFKSFQEYYDYLVNEPSPKAMVELVNRISTALERPVPHNIIEYPDSYPADEPNRRAPDIHKARLQLKYAPSVELNDGLKRFLYWADTVYTGEQ